MLEQAWSLEHLATTTKASDRQPAVSGFAVRNAPNETLVFDIYDEISSSGMFGVSADMLRRSLRGANPRRVEINLNSPGGEVFEALAMYSDLKRHPAPVHVRVTGLAASAASVLAMAGDTIEISPAAFFMVHSSHVVVAGNKIDLASVVELLTKVDTTLAELYADRTGAPAETVAKWLSGETWFTAAEALAAGLADSVSAEALPVAASADLSKFRNPPRALVNRPREDYGILAEMARSLTETMRSGN